MNSHAQTWPQVLSYEDSEKSSWGVALLMAFAVHAVLVGAGAWEHRDNLLDLINQGEIAEAPVVSIPARPEEHVFEIDLSQEIPPLTEEPDFIKPVEDEPKIDPIVQLEEPPPIPEQRIPPPEIVKKAELAPPTPAQPKIDPGLTATAAPLAPPMPAIASAPVEPSASNARNELSYGYSSSGVRIGNKDFPKPLYPYEARIKRFQGTVVLSISVVNGKITSTEILSSSGYGLLDVSAISWIQKKWKFPEDVTATITQSVKFELTQS